MTSARADTGKPWWRKVRASAAMRVRFYLSRSERYEPLFRE